MARAGTPHCSDCDKPIGTQTSDQVCDKVMAMPEGTKAYLMSPITMEVGQKFETLWEDLRANGYLRVRVNGTTHSLDEPPQIDRRRKHTVEVVIDRVIIKAIQTHIGRISVAAVKHAMRCLRDGPDSRRGDRLSRGRSRDIGTPDRWAGQDGAP